MSKRFPIPEFDRDQYKNMEWREPRLLDEKERKALAAKAASGDASAFGCHAVQAPEALYERFKLRGPHRHAMMCLAPKAGVRVLGRSWAWQIQRALVLDSLEADAAVVHEWTTPRCMNTRLGPDNGVEVPGGALYVVVGHQYGDHWIGNRAMRDPRPAQAGGFTLVSSSDESNNDFHACNLTFTWT